MDRERAGDLNETFPMPRLIESLLRVHDDGKKLIVLKSYFFIKDQVIQIPRADRERSTPTAEAIRSWREVHDNLFGFCGDAHNKMFGTRISVVCEHGPSVHHIWNEIKTPQWVLNLYQDDPHVISHRGIFTTPLNAYMLDRLRAQTTSIHPDIENMLGKLFQEQPRYALRSGPHFNHFDIAFSWDQPEIAELTQLMHCIERQHQHEYFRAILEIFGALATWACAVNFHRDIMSEHIGWSLKDTVRELEEIYESLVCDPFSPYPINLRRQLASVNFVNIAGVFAWHGVAKSIQMPLDFVSWHFHKKVYAYCLAAQRTPLEKATLEWSVTLTRWQQVIHAGAIEYFAIFESMTRYIPGDILPDDDEDSDDDLGRELEVAELSDVNFRPSGPPLDVNTCAVRAPVLLPAGATCSICMEEFGLFMFQGPKMYAMKTSCGHIFHRGCLETLINGISTFSNLCPECRHQICAPRPKEPILRGESPPP